MCHQMQSHTTSVPCSTSVQRLSRSRQVICACFLSAAVVHTAQAQSTDCQCRAPDGSMRDLGTVECVDIVGTRSLVRCEMSTNTPYWRKLDLVDGCPSV